MDTGQLIFREAGEAPTKDGRRLYMVVGLIAVDPKIFPFKGEHQYILKGEAVVAGGYTLSVDPSTEKDLTQTLRGLSIGGALLQPIWRV